jgi:hypothetical protein
MKPKEAAVIVGVITVIWHLVSLLEDVERYKLNLAQWRGAPTGRNLVRLALAEGILIEDIASF